MINWMIEILLLVYVRVVGFLYFIIIVFGLFVEIFVCLLIIIFGDVIVIVGSILGVEGFFCVGFLVDLIMLLSDVVFVVLLFIFLKLVNKIFVFVVLFFWLM